jgi:hypothetical protein
MTTAHSEQENGHCEQQAADDDGLEREPNDSLLHRVTRPAAAARNAKRPGSLLGLAGARRVDAPPGNLVLLADFCTVKAAVGWGERMPREISHRSPLRSDTPAALRRRRPAPDASPGVSVRRADGLSTPSPWNWTPKRLRWIPHRKSSATTKRPPCGQLRTTPIRAKRLSASAVLPGQCPVAAAALRFLIAQPDAPASAWPSLAAAPAADGRHPGRPGPTVQQNVSAEGLA